MSELRAVIFDLDGVLTDTAEFHHRAWQKLTDEEGLSFSREVNEKLRGVSRRESLLRILGERQVDEATLEAWMTRKNGYDQEMLRQVSPADLLPGVPALLFRWYNHGYRHSALSLMTPATIHAGRGAAVLQQRRKILSAAYAAHPERFVQGQPQPGKLPDGGCTNELNIKLLIWLSQND